VHVGVEKWSVVFGGSWGSTLALSYAIRHADRVGALVLRGIFLFDEPSMKSLFGYGGASEMYPDAFEKYEGLIPAEERADLLEAYYRRVNSADLSVALPASREFVRWELSISKLQVNVAAIDHLLEDDGFVLPFARAETLFFVKNGFFPTAAEDAASGDPGAETDPALPWILRHADRIRHIPAAIVHGRQDIVCRPRAAWELHKRLPHSSLEFIFDAGHSDSEPGIVDALVRATDRFLHTE
jgi:proline iminopeptidase